uniref:non-specific serine/threonine protein kinase n=1 Tax=Parastrongyloides trichosuri TaxID=131310 RepID=A0A0N4Z0S5_PARTI
MISSKKFNSQLPLKSPKKDYKSIQEEEKMVLESMYPNDIIECKTTTAWKTWQPMDITMMIKPTSSSSMNAMDRKENFEKKKKKDNCLDKSGYIYIKLEFICGITYPDSIPQFRVLDSSGIEKVRIDNLINHLKKLGNEKKGFAMIADLYAEASDFLYKMRKPAIKNLHEGMLENEAEKTKQKNHEISVTEQLVVKEVEKETIRREVERQRLLEEKEFEEKKKLDLIDKTKRCGAVGDGEMITCLDGINRTFYLQKTESDDVISTRRKVTSNHVKEFTVIDQMTQVYVSEWSFQWRDHKKIQQLGKKNNNVPPSPSKNLSPDFSNFLHELDKFITGARITLQTIDSIDQSIYPYLFLTKKEVANEPGHIHIKVIVGQLINKVDRSLESVFDNLQDIETGEMIIPRVACQAVCALKWLHEEKLIHGRLGLDSIWLTTNDCIRISDWFVTGRLAKFAEDWDHLVHAPKAKLTRNGSSTETESGNNSINDDLIYGKCTKVDLVSLGRVLQSMSSRIQECDRAKSVDQLCNHIFLNHNLLTMPRSWFPGATKGELEDLTKFDNDRLTDFFLVSYLGKGGFGEVLLANNKLDGNNYAIKRIPLFLSSKEMQKKIINEARLFSKLHHPNVVRYYNGEKTYEILFIQMEYCEKQTLRNLIDSGNLLINTEEIWRLFREMLSGLDYIHKKDMIHRDIKPLNIFIDAHNRVKIGDFGLATIDVNGKKNHLQLNNSDHTSSSLNLEEGISQGQDLTQDVGTALYIAPEINADSGYAGKTYTSKIDVYSLGIVLFEMFYRPLPLGMERLVILPKLRNSLEFPSDFGAEITTNQSKRAKDVITWMLQKDQHKRPSVSDLIKSDRVPLVGVEENDIQLAVKEILRNRKSTLNKWIYDTIFSTDSPFAVRHIFDKKTCLSLKEVHGQRTLEYIKKQMSEFFFVHGFTPYDCHTLIPEFSDLNNKNKSSRTRSFKVLDKSGILLNLSSDLRRNFVRVCCRNALDNVKRFCYGKIFTQVDDIPGTHPVERINCAIDIVGGKESSHELSSELLFMMGNIPRQIVVIKSMKTIIRIGDLRLYYAVCKHIGITNDQLIASVRNTLAQFSMQTKDISQEEKLRKLLTAGLTKNVASSLLKHLEPYLSLDLLKNGLIKQLQNSKYYEVQEIAKNVIGDFIKMMEYYEILVSSSKRQQPTMIFDPSIIIKSELYSTSLVAIVSVYVPKFDGHENYKPHHIITGGRYDKYLESKRQVDDHKPANEVCAMGCSVDLSIISYLITNHLYKTGFSIPTFSTLVGYTDNKLLKNVAYKLLAELWKNGVSADIHHQPISNTEDAIEICKEKGIKNLLLAIDTNNILVTQNEGLQYGKMSPEYHAIHQQKYTIEEAVEHLVTSEEYSFDQLNNGISQINLGTPSTSAPRRVRVRSRNNSNPNDGLSRDSMMIQSVERNAIAQTNNTHSTATFANNADIVYALQDKPNHNTKRKIESFIRNNFNDSITSFSPKQRIIIIVSDASTDLLRNIVANVDVHCTTEHFDSIFTEILINCKVGKSKSKTSADILGIELKKYLFTVSFQRVIALCTTQDEKFYKILS